MKDDGLIWKIAAGIIVASLFMAGFRQYQQQMAIRQFNESMARISIAAAAQSKKLQAEMAERNAVRERQAAAKRQAEIDAKTLLPGQRCIGKDLFNRVDNGWVQVMDGSAKQKCGR